MLERRRAHRRASPLGVCSQRAELASACPCVDNSPALSSVAEVTGPCSIGAILSELPATRVEKSPFPAKKGAGHHHGVGQAVGRVGWQTFRRVKFGGGAAAGGGAPHTHAHLACPHGVPTAVDTRLDRANYMAVARSSRHVESDG